MRSERLVALRRRLVPYGLLGPGIGWLILFFVVPLYFMGRLSLESGIFPEFHFDWNFGNYSDALSTYDTQFIRAFEYSAVASVIALLIAYPLAYAIAFRGGRWKNAMLLAVIAPFFTTYLIRTLAWETILSDNGFVVNTLQTLGLISSDGRLLATTPAVIAGLTYNFLPFMILPIYASLERMDTSLIEAAKDLYASSRKAFLRVTLPLSMPGVVAGTLLTFIPATGDYINAQFLGGAQQQMIGNVIQSLYLKQTDYPAAAALSFILMATMLLVVFIYIRFAGSEALMGEEVERR
ncbi:MAG TPA: ABC transporter permease [Solirubrobacterales bacterium]|jgi:spermidine/putrescine transport system permease protein|nr:ABC transporter permease [Solirubrobacterales bacterium]